MNIRSGFQGLRGAAIGIALAGLLLVASLTYAADRADRDAGRWGMAPSRVEVNPGTIWLVASRADSGAGTLRQALLNAQAGDTIRFDTAVFPPGSPATITLLSALPALARGNITIDGSDAGVILDGGLTPGGTNGFYVVSDSNVIKGLKIVRFPTDGVQIANGARSNQIGGDWRIGSAPRGQGNIITLNGDDGVDLGGSGTMHNIVTGNLIGVDADGTTDLRIQAMAISPAFGQDHTLFTGTRFQGVWRSTDGGAGWSVASTGLSILDVRSIAISPGYTSDRTLFVGTAQGKIFRTTDGSVTWSQVYAAQLPVGVVAVAISPAFAVDRNIFATTDGLGILASTDGGSSWAFGNTGITDQVVHAISLSPAYAQ